MEQEKIDKILSLTKDTIPEFTIRQLRDLEKKYPDDQSASRMYERLSYMFAMILTSAGLPTDEEEILDLPANGVVAQHMNQLIQNSVPVGNDGGSTSTQLSEADSTGVLPT